jgi:Ca-activated chloride channel family protein
MSDSHSHTDDEKSTEAKQARDEIDAAVQVWKDKWYEEIESE